METARTRRKLAAILAADVVGYSRLLAEDETATLKALNGFRKTRFEPAVSRHGGRIVKLMGDGALVEFASVVDAVGCAVELQKLAAGSEDKPRITLRIGINLGDVVQQDGDIFGDGVNIAARLEPLARPGGICVSAIVKESAGNRIPVRFSDGGLVNVKNIDHPLQVWHWHPGDTGSDATVAISESATASQPDASIAVLPFDNLSRDADQEYFSDGISEDIITDLSKLPGLLVIARNSSFAYRGRSVDLRQVGRDLGVAAVLEGSVRRSGNRVRVNAQLVDTTTGGHLWAERYDRDMTDIFAVQDDVTLQIVEALKVKLTPAQRQRIASPTNVDPGVHDLFLRARSLTLAPNLTADMCRQAIAHARKAVAMSPVYSRAHACLAMALWFGLLNGWTGEDREGVQSEIDAHARTALELEPDNPEALQMFAVSARSRGDMQAASATISKALSINPNFASGLLTRGNIALYSGRPRDAIPDYERAIRLDPEVAHQYMHFLGVAHLLLGHDETAAMVLRQRLLQSPNSDVGRAILASALGHLGRTDEACKVWAELMAIKPDYTWASHLSRLPLTSQADFSRIPEGLRKAGLPA